MNLRNTFHRKYLMFMLTVLLNHQLSFSADTSNAESVLRRSLDSMETLQRSGGWAMAWSSDVKLTIGEHKAKAYNTITVQYPAAPGVGMIFLCASQVLKDDGYLNIAKKAGDALIEGQLDCGGFPHEYSPGNRKDGSGTFDDDTTQSAVRFFVELWNVTKQKRYADAAKRCGQFMLNSQYSNGGFPQQYPLRKGYSRYITLNDDAMMDVIRALLLCYHTYDEKKYYDAALRGADCLLVLQGKTPQAGWAQQFTETGEPAAARRFEPVALSSAESVGALQLLLEVYVETGNKKYLNAGAAAFAWLERSQLPNGKWARYYEYGSNNDLYCTPDGTIIRDVNRARPGYGWQGEYYKPKMKRLYVELLDASTGNRHEIYAKYQPSLSQRQLENRIQPVLKNLNADGWWLSSLSVMHQEEYQVQFGSPEGVKAISTSVFVRNTSILLDSLESRK